MTKAEDPTAIGMTASIQSMLLRSALSPSILCWKVVRSIPAPFSS